MKRNNIHLFLSVSAVLIIKSCDGFSVANLPSAIWKKLFYLEPEVSMSVTQMVEYYGYPIETHTVTTDDGYILTNHRIPYGKNHPADPNKIPVLLLHGSYLLSDVWVSNTPNKNFAFLLADAGYDVWMINIRGNYYSRKHETLSTSQAKYWEFSWDEVAYYDLAAFVDDVLEKTGKNQVYIVGHSLGGALPFALLSTKSEYSEKVRTIYGLSPMGNNAGHSKFLLLMAKIFTPLVKALPALGIHIFVVPHWLPSELLGFFAKTFEPILKILLFDLLGPDKESWNGTRLPLFSNHVNGGLAVNFLLHYAQSGANPAFKHFDWGPEMNLIKYGQNSPPTYDLKKVTTPTYLFYETNDRIICYEGVEFLKNNLGNVVNMSIAGHGNHNSYFWGNDTDVFYNNLVAEMVKDSEK